MKRVITTVAAVAAALCAVPAGAVVHTLTFQDVRFSMEAVDDHTFTLRIQDALDAVGDWADVQYLKAFLVKDIGSFSGASVRGDAAWAYSSNQLSANACSGGANAHNLCFSRATPMALSNDMSFTVDVVGGLVDFAAGSTPNPHLMVNFFENLGDARKTGSNLSQDIPAIPEPQTYALMLAGAAAVVFVARRRRR